MPIAVFGKKTFRISSNKVYTFDELSFSGSLLTENQDVKGKKPSTLIKGPGLKPMAFNIKLDASLGVNVWLEIKSWMSLCEGGIPQVFSIGGVPISSNKWLIKTVNVKDSVINNNGKWLKALLELTFEEYVRPGTVPKNIKKTVAKKKGKSKTKKTKTKTTTRVNIDSLIGKRNNPNVSKAVRNGTKKRLAGGSQ